MLGKLARKLDAECLDPVCLAAAGLLSARLPAGPALFAAVYPVADIARITRIVLEINCYCVDILLFALLAKGKNTAAERTFLVSVRLHARFSGKRIHVCCSCSGCCGIGIDLNLIKARKSTRQGKCN